MDYIMKIFGRFEADGGEAIASKSQEVLEGGKSTESREEVKGGDLRTTYLSSFQRPKRRNVMGYLSDMFKFGKDESFQLERDEDGYVKKLYSERVDSRSESDGKANVMSYVKKFFGTKPKQRDPTLRGGEERTEKLLAKVITQHGDDWFQDMDETHVLSEMIEENSKPKKFFSDGAEKLLAKIAIQHGNEWFQDLDERGDTELHQVDEGPIASFLREIFTAKTQNNPNDEYGAGVPEEKQQIFSYLKDLLETFDFPNAQREEKIVREEISKAKVYLGRLFGMEHVEQAKIEARVIDGEEAENEYDGKILAYLDDLFKSKPESDPGHVNDPIAIESALEESEDMVSIANRFEEEDADEQLKIVEVEEEDWIEDQETCGKSCEGGQRNFHEVPATGLINCAVNVAKIFSRGNYPPDGDPVTEGEKLPADEDMFEEALDELSLPTTTNGQKISVKEPVPSHKQGSVLHTIFNSGYKYIIPQSPLLRQCRRFLDPPGTLASSNETDEERAVIDENPVSDGDGSIEGADVFEDAQDSLAEKRGISFLVGGEDLSGIIVLGKDEDEATSSKDVPRDFWEEQQHNAHPDDVNQQQKHSLTITAPEILGLLDPNLGARGPRDSRALGGVEKSGDEPRGNPSLAFAERFGKHAPGENEIRFLTPEKHNGRRDVLALALGKAEPETEDPNATQKLPKLS